MVKTSSLRQAQGLDNVDSFVETSVFCSDLSNHAHSRIKSYDPFLYFRCQIPPHLDQFQRRRALVCMSLAAASASSTASLHLSHCHHFGSKLCRILSFKQF
ncbi:unnamed protein product [Durusdinium trenchii]|uniref:Uncharacterized protein n=1 Tax=Durusdinium trenchii TaxID=1381693 RepID=A0ABP0KBZ6_9DINO